MRPAWRLFCGDVADEGVVVGRVPPYDAYRDVLVGIMAYVGPSVDLSRMARVCRYWSRIAGRIMRDRDLIIVADGSTNGAMRVYDVVLRRWSDLPAHPSTQCVVLLNNRLVAIGIGTISELVDGQWRPLAACSALDRFSMACILDGDLVVVCGYEKGQTIVMLRETRSGEWRELTRLRQHVCLASVGVIVRDQHRVLLLVGGDDDGRLVDLSLTLDPSDGSWRCLPRPPLGPHFPDGFTVWRNQLVIAGGWSRVLREKRTRRCSTFDIDDLTWRSLTPLPENHVVAGLTVAGDNLIALVDDADESGAAVRLVQYVESKWVPMASMDVVGMRRSTPGKDVPGRAWTVLGTRASDWSPK
ncbi:unnamed protein product (mitochondrion) [Plasmodiophora brassicae]|uniref:F-box domain-containing protein n=1 Tax=Plasmodiophora brassicae TaxID=37360 RepID=A0A0G4IPA8_PLABS|nr:hypothetical protein PBRA_005680 [Plasmodiophora brassicae]SPR01055.1 unnamed protein product [Plasmodiophora brassicae]